MLLTWPSVQTNDSLAKRTITASRNLGISHPFLTRLDVGIFRIRRTTGLFTHHRILVRPGRNTMLAETVNINKPPPGKHSQENAPFLPKQRDSYPTPSDPSPPETPPTRPAAPATRPRSSAAPPAPRPPSPSPLTRASRLRPGGPTATASRAPFPSPLPVVRRTGADAEKRGTGGGLAAAAVVAGREA